MLSQSHFTCSNLTVSQMNLLYSLTLKRITKGAYLEIDGKFEIAGLDSRSLYELCMQLQHLEQNMPEQDSFFKFPDGFSLFKKND